MSSEKADISKIDVLGPRIQFLTPLSGNDENYCLVTGAVPAGVVVPLHSHAERETFYVLGGERIARACLALAMYSMCLAVSSTPGETHLARPHRCWWCLCGWAGSFALSADPYRLLRMRRSQLISSVVETAHAYGYWLGSPADNAAAGISVG
jgi:hypothetical protein